MRPNSNISGLGALHRMEKRLKDINQIGTCLQTTELHIDTHTATFVLLGVYRLLEGLKAFVTFGKGPVFSSNSIGQTRGAPWLAGPGVSRAYVQRE